MLSGLEFRAFSFAARAVSLHPQQKGVPVNSEKDADRDRGEAERVESESGVADRSTFADQGASEIRALPRLVALSDADSKSLIRSAKVEVEGGIQITEWRYVEFFGVALSEALCPVFSDEKKFLLVERVIHFGDGIKWIAVFIVYEVKGDWVEDVTKGTKVSEEVDRADFAGIAGLRFEVGGYVFLDGWLACVVVVAGSELIGSPATGVDQVKAF